MEEFGPYRLRRLLGRGGMGEVHEAFDTRRERTVALKRLHPEAQSDPDTRKRFRRESRTVGELDSPHVIPIHDFGVIDDRMFIDMRLVRGQDLGARLARAGRLQPISAIEIIEQVADALGAAHRAGLVHRDVKPSNVLLGRRDFAYLADFGIVHIRESTGSLTASGASPGTPAYMAPEQLRAERFDHRLDVYALGCVLFELVTGRPPFVGHKAAIMVAHLQEPPPRPSALVDDLPAGLDDVVLAALAKRADGRPSSVGEFVAASRRTLVGRPRPAATAHAVTAAPPPPMQTRRATREAPDVASVSRRRGSPLVPPSSPLRDVPSPGPAAGKIERNQDTATRPAPPRYRTMLMAIVLAVVLPPVGAVVGVAVRRRSTGVTRRAATSAVVLGVLLTLVVSVGGVLAARNSRQPFVSAARVESQMVATTGLPAGAVKCPESLPAVVGATLDCTATVRERSQTLRATVTSVVGEQVTFGVVADQSQGSGNSSG
ncbi:protein kinase domain-containing protein [Actinomycetospora callitridis]|uniref:protein kinase domain-containing protein n=1 Tax=Actinomycetospora callitridis TaxID=913944 RepID=UPI0023667002|nr:protein kinase [Actinomycetospora callitridis]MDD7920302.1 protein kinase [Actinomycetospora callitridis]